MVTLDTLEFNGKTFIAVRSAAENLGYSSDYIGQLCRSGKVSARFVGGCWYVSEEALLAHLGKRFRVSASTETPREETSLVGSDSVEEVVSPQPAENLSSFLYIKAEEPLFKNDDIFISPPVVSSPLPPVEKRVAPFLWALPVAVLCFLSASFSLFTVQKFSAHNSATVISGLSGNTSQTTQETPQNTVALEFPDIGNSTQATTVTETPPALRATPTEKIIERAVASGLTESYVDQKLQELNNKLSSQIYSITAQGNTNTQRITEQTTVIAQTNRIDKLSGTAITNASISGSAITSSSVSATSLSVSGETSLASLTTTDTSATSTFAGGVLFTRAPTLPHTFSPWAIGTANSSLFNASFVVNPASAVADSNLISAAVNGSVKFLVDAEGDVFTNSLTSIGSVTLSNTTASTFAVEGNTTLGDAITDTSTVNGTLTVTGTTTVATTAGNFGVGSTTPFARLSVTGIGSTTGVNFQTTNSSHNPLLTVLDSGNVGIGTSTPSKRLSVTNTVSDAQFSLAYDDTRYAHFQVDSAGDLVVNPSGDDLSLLDDNLWVCAGGACPSGTPSGTGNLIVETKVGIGTSSPWSQLSIGAGGAITTVEKTLTDSATISISWTDGNQQKVTLGGNRTIAFSNYIAGQTLRLVVCQDGTGSRTLTWDSNVLWSTGSAPTLTTTANKCDVTTFLATMATSSLKIFGASVLAF